VTEIPRLVVNRGDRGEMKSIERTIQDKDGTNGQARTDVQPLRRSRWRQLDSVTTK
jgi:hypothetical protein